MNRDGYLYVFDAIDFGWESLEDVDEGSPFARGLIDAIESAYGERQRQKDGKPMLKVLPVPLSVEWGWVYVTKLENNGSVCIFSGFDMEHSWLALASHHSPPPRMVTVYEVADSVPGVCDAAPQEPCATKSDPLLAAWRAWLVEAASLAETPVDCLDMAREIREGAAHGLTLGEGDSHLPRPRPTPEGVGRFLYTVEMESLRTRNERLREKAAALLDVMHGLEEFYDEMIALRDELDRYDDETETNGEGES